MEAAEACLARHGPVGSPAGPLPFPSRAAELLKRFSGVAVRTSSSPQRPCYQPINSLLWQNESLFWPNWEFRRHAPGNGRNPRSLVEEIAQYPAVSLLFSRICEIFPVHRESSLSFACSLVLAIETSEMMRAEGEKQDDRDGDADQPQDDGSHYSYLRHGRPAQK